MLNLIAGFLAQGRTVDLVLCQAKGVYLGEIPAGAKMIELRATGSIQSRWHAAMGNRGKIPALLRPVLLARKIAPEIARIRSLQHYLQQARPDIILSALTYANLVALWAKRLSGTRVPVVISERIALSNYCTASSNARKWRWRYLPDMVRHTYPDADAVVAVSEHVANDLVCSIGLDRQSVSTVYNPVVDDTLRTRAHQALAHPWFTPGAAPVVLSAGRLTEQKDFATLLHAFARLRAVREARLVILGEGRLRKKLEALAEHLGIRADVDLPGFVENPFKYMARASVLVLSSRYEGLPGVLIQALACGCPVISTDCPGGSREILAEGRYGTLVDVGDTAGIAAAILETLDNPTPTDRLRQRADDFTVAHSVSNYLELLDAVAARAAARAPETT